jgi:hypothetical protein
MLCGLEAGCPCVDIGPIEGVVEADDGAGEGAKESGELTYAGLKQLSAAMQVLPLLLRSRKARPAARTGRNAQTARITHSQARQVPCAVVGPAPCAPSSGAWSCRAAGSLSSLQASPPPPAPEGQHARRKSSRQRQTSLTRPPTSQGDLDGHTSRARRALTPPRLSSSICFADGLRGEAVHTKCTRFHLATGIDFGRTILNFSNSLLLIELSKPWSRSWGPKF